MAARAQTHAAVFLVAQESAEIVGFVLGSPARQNDGSGEIIAGLLHLGYVAVAPSRWGGGVASRLVRRVLDEAPMLGYARVQLWRHAINERAKRV